MFRRNRVRDDDDEMIVSKAEWLDMCDRAQSTSATRVLAAQRRVQRPAGLSDEQIEQLLTEHYRQVLASKAGRSMWRRLLRQAEAVSTVESIKKS